MRGTNKYNNALLVLTTEGTHIVGNAICELKRRHDSTVAHNDFGAACATSFVLRVVKGNRVFNFFTLQKQICTGKKLCAKQIPLESKVCIKRKKVKIYFTA